MTFHVIGPGKTAPKLYQDFLIFDPVKGRPSVLAEFTPPQGEGPQLAPAIGSCRHDYVTKASQSKPPPLDLRPDGNTIYKLAVVCKKCRIHADIVIDHSDASSPCPASDHPLHHFQRASAYDRTTTDRIQYAWKCSVAECRASLMIIYRKPRLDDDDIQLLANPELLKRRYNALVQDEPDREGMRLATQMDALARLRRYVKDSLVPEHTKRQIPANNKRFQEAYGKNGEDCAEILQGLGFTYADNIWTLPNPEPIDDRIQADGSSMREILEDVEIELLLWMCKLAAEYGLTNPHAGEILSSADKDIERTLAAQGYTRYVALRRATPNEAIPYFNSLGVLPDFSDSLIEYAYDRQASCDPGLQAYYVECLQVITENRYSEHLQMKLVTLQSQDIVSRRDLSAAYRFFNISAVEAKSLSDVLVVERYQARLPDLSVASQHSAREHLYKIALSRNSQLLLNASQQSVDTYEDALSWLGNGVNKDTSDEGILAVLTLKTAESKANEEIGQKAVATIAKARKSNHLNQFLLTGQQGGYTMSVDEALRHLNIDQKLDDIDQTVLPTIFDGARQDRPGETTEKAISTIQQAMTNGVGTASHAPESWPVGLTSHGNTCYLNSLLQYYFSIKPLRDIVLNYDPYKLDTLVDGEKPSRVGQRKIKKVEIEGGQRFAEDLKRLFERMIRSRDSAVKPETDLVCRAFLDPKEYKLLGQIIDTENVNKKGDAIANGTASAIDETANDEAILASPDTLAPEERKASDASSTTLQASVNGEPKDVTMKDAALPPTPPGTPGADGGEKPPPLPVRRFSTTKQEALAKAEAKARQQQDVTEVHDQISFLLRCGINPRVGKPNEEQQDALRDLFSLRMTQTTVNKGVEQKPEVLIDSAIQLNVPMEPTDIYSALDAVFDLQPYADNPAMETYKSIEDLPPLLQINIPRIGFDATRASGAAFKSTDCVSLKDEIYLDRYLDNSHESILPKRRECWGWRRELQGLKRQQKVLSNTAIDLDGPSTLFQTAQYLTTLDEVNRDLESIDVEPIEADGDITQALLADAEQQGLVLADLDVKIRTLQQQLNTQFENLKQIKYRLAAVFFHRGSHGHGHYWVYIHDFKNNVWRIYNDEKVEEFTKMESIFEARTWDQGTPTYAVYVAEDKMDYVEAVFRDLEPEPEMPPLISVDHATNNAASNHTEAAGVDPKMVMDGGMNSWDEQRQVAAAAMGI